MSRASQSINKNDDNTNNPEGGRLSEGNRLIAFADEFTTAVRSRDNQNYLLFDDSSHIAVPLSGPSSPAMQLVANRYLKDSGKWAAHASKALAADYFDAQCQVAPVTDVALRAQYISNTVYLDTCWAGNQVIQVDASGVTVTSFCPAVFVRSGVSAALPDLVGTGLPLTRLLDYIRIPESALPALLACLVNSMLTTLPQPLMLIQGPAGTGKTTSLRLLMDLIDPTSSIPGGSLSEDEKEIRTLSKVRRVLVFDNVSYIKGDASDLLAKITTGSELISRSLYTNATPDVIQLRRPVILNGIIDGFSRSDLASRSVAFNLQPVAMGERIAERELLAQWQKELPQLFRGLLDLMSLVLKELPSAETPETTFRNPDLMKITQIIGNHFGIDGLAHLERSVADLSASVLGASAMGQAFTNLVTCQAGDTCSHFNYGEQPIMQLYGQQLTVETLRKALVQHIDQSEHKNIPALAKGFGEALKRIESDLQSVLGLTVGRKRKPQGMTYILEVQ